MPTLTKDHLKGGSAPIRFFWTMREDGAEVFHCRRSDGRIVEVLSLEEIASVEELIAELQPRPKARGFFHFR